MQKITLSNNDNILMLGSKGQNAISCKHDMAFELETRQT